MSRNYKIRDQSKPYFVTFTVVYWMDIFIRDEYRNILIDSLNYCKANKGLEIYAYCFMTNHIHLIIGTNQQQNLEGIIRDFKSFTSRSIRKLLEDFSFKESRRDWLYWMMKRAGNKNGNNKDFQLWQQHNHPIELNSNHKINQRLNYLHNNPVKAGFVHNSEDYVYSSAGNYCGRQGMLDVCFI